MKSKVLTDVEHLKKLFIFPESQDKFLNFGLQILDMLDKSFRQKEGLHSTISLEDLEKLFSDIDIPYEPQLLKDIFPQIREKIFKHSVKVYSPYYIGHMTSAVPYFTLLLEMIIAALNQNQVKIETAKASTYVERELLAWIHRLIYKKEPGFYKRLIQNRDFALGNVTVDGTLANLTAMLVARNKLFAPNKDFAGVNRAGLAEAYEHYNVKRCVILISERGHYSFDKIADALGIGDKNIIKIPVDSYNKIDIKLLKKKIDEIKSYNNYHEKKIKILSLVGIAGTTETGNIDNLYEMQKIAQREKIHFHVDAAWGGPVLFVKEYCHLFSGIEHADSVTFDSHKLLYLPLSMGMVLFKNERDLKMVEHTTRYVVRKKSRDLGRFTLEGSRPFSALRPWTALKVIGSEGFRLLFENAFNLTSYLRTQIQIHPNFEDLNQPELFIFNYRFVPPRVRERLKALLLESDDKVSQEKIKKINNELNTLNKQLHRAIRSHNRSFVSRTVLESTKYRPNQVVVLRAVTINPLTTTEILKEIVTEHNRLGTDLYEREFKKRLQNI